MDRFQNAFCALARKLRVTDHISKMALDHIVVVSSAVGPAGQLTGLARTEGLECVEEAVLD